MGRDDAHEMGPSGMADQRDPAGIDAEFIGMVDHVHDHAGDVVAEVGATRRTRRAARAGS